MKLNNKTSWIIFAFLLLTFLLIEANGLNHYDPGDEHIYFHRAELLATGKMPYKDFFFAHPPMQLFISAPLIKLFGFNFILLKSIPLIATMLSALFLFLLMKKYSKTKAILAVILFLFTYNTMLEATYFLGINITTMFIVISIYFLFEKKYLAAGIFSGFAGLTGLYSLIPITVIFIFLLLIKSKTLLTRELISRRKIFSFINIFKEKQKKEFFNFLIGFSLIFVLINLIFILLYGNNYLTPVYKYHLLKPKAVSSTIQTFYIIIKNNFILFASAFLFIFAKNKKKFLLIITSSLIYLLFLTQLTKIFNFYFVLLFPFLAILGSSALVDLYKKLKIKKSIKLIIPFIFLIIILTGITFSSIKLIKFDFIDFQSLDKISNFIKTNSKTDELIFGDDSSIHLISKFSERNIALDNIDTNDMIFKSGIINLQQTINNLKKENIKFIIIRPLYGIGALEEFSSYLEKECSLAKWFKDYYYGDFLIYDCKI